MKQEVNFLHSAPDISKVTSRLKLTIEITIAIQLLVWGLVKLDSYQLTKLQKQSQELTQISIDKARQLEQAKTIQANESEQKNIVTRVKEQEEQLQALKLVQKQIKLSSINNPNGISGYLTAFAKSSVRGVWLSSLNFSSYGAVVSAEGTTDDPELLNEFKAKLSSHSNLTAMKFTIEDIKTNSENYRYDNFVLIGELKH